MTKQPVKKKNPTIAVAFLEQISLRLTNWVGTPSSVVAHTIVFAVCFTLPFLGIGLDKVLLILTTAVSLEAIYLAIFIQMTVNRNTKSLEEVEEDIEDIQEDLDDIQEDEKEDDQTEVATKLTLDKIQNNLNLLLQDVENLKKQSDNRTATK